MKPTFLFDLDGTLIDSIELICRSYEHAAREHLGSPVDSSVWREGIGRPLAWQFGQLTDDPELVRTLIDEYRKFNLKHHDLLINEYDGALEAVRELRARGCRLGIVTSKVRKLAERGLRVGGFVGLFEVVIGIDDVERAKPDPEPVQRALEELGARPEQAVFIGDSPHDLRAGRAAGVLTAAALWGPFSRERLAEEDPDFYLEAPGEIPGLVAAITS